MYKTTAFALLALTAIIHMVFGVIYVTADQFMSYHAKALSTSWAELDAHYQVLILALIKLAGAGGLIAGAVNLITVLYFWNRPYAPIVWLGPFSAAVFQVSTNYVVYQVSISTPGNPPLFWVSFGSCVLLVAILLFCIWVFDQRKMEPIEQHKTTHDDKQKER